MNLYSLHASAKKIEKQIFLILSRAGRLLFLLGGFTLRHFSEGSLRELQWNDDDDDT